MRVKKWPPEDVVSTSEVIPPVPLGLKPFFSVQLAATAAVITVGNIPATGNHLYCVLHCQDITAAQDSFQGYLKINNDGTAGNYAQTQYMVAQAAAIAGNTLAPLAGAGTPVYRSPGVKTLSYANATNLIWIPFYTTNIFTPALKNIHCDSCERATVQTNNWKLTSEWAGNTINRLDFTTGASQFAIGTSLTVYIL